MAGLERGSDEHLLVSDDEEDYGSGRRSPSSLVFSRTLSGADRYAFRDSSHIVEYGSRKSPKQKVHWLRENRGVITASFGIALILVGKFAFHADAKLMPYVAGIDFRAQVASLIASFVSVLFSFPAMLQSNNKDFRIQLREGFGQEVEFQPTGKCARLCQRMSHAPNDQWLGYGSSALLLLGIAVAAVPAAFSAPGDYSKTMHAAVILSCVAATLCATWYGGRKFAPKALTSGTANDDVADAADRRSDHSLATWHGNNDGRSRSGTPTSLEDGYQAPGYLAPDDEVKPATTSTWNPAHNSVIRTSVTRTQHAAHLGWRPSEAVSSDSDSDPETGLPG